MLDLLLLVQWHPPFMILAPSCNMHYILCNPCGCAYLHHSHHPGHVSDNTLDYVPDLGALYVMACVSQRNHIYNAVVMCRLIHTLGQCCDQVTACQTALRDLHKLTFIHNTISHFSKPAVPQVTRSDRAQSQLLWVFHLTTWI